ncbi:HlyD family secretion protein [Tahibacter harae]|uniref:HlyD family secretion protein n=1 Tax=Tahibacter harae TaxID=2963937 RepID=A0ABT1QQH8_9GAMM|nr:HlyD family secretion protein [Tahibacter harae]MCQ4164551.1 HlyD family secretion protein [Tahibacter harae]
MTATTETAAPAAAPRKRANTLLWIVGPALVLGLAGYFYLTGGRYVDTDNAYVQADQITIAPQIGGRVSEVLVRENQPVKAGDLLFRLDQEPLQIAVQRLEAQLESVRSMLDGARNGYRGAEADLRSAESDLQHAQQQFARVQDLRTRGLVAQQALDDAANAVASARGKRDSNSAAVAKAQNLLGGLPGANNESLPGYKLALAQLAQARLDLSHAEVRAPVDGVIGKTDLQAGEFLSVGQPAMPLVATGNLWVEANFKETDLTNVSVGQSAEVAIDTYPGRHWKARVASISPASGAEFAVLPAQNATGNWVKIVQRIPVRLLLEPENGAPQLRAGMSAEVQIDTGRERARYSHFFGAAPAQEPVASR